MTWTLRSSWGCGRKSLAADVAAVDHESSENAHGEQDRGRWRVDEEDHTSEKATGGYVDKVINHASIIGLKSLKVKQGTWIMAKASSSAIRARPGFVELFVDNSKLVSGLRLAANNVKAFGSRVRNRG